MRPRYRFVAVKSQRGEGTHLWRLDAETGEAWHYLLASGREAREEIERQTGKKTSWYSEPRNSEQPVDATSTVA